MSVKGFDRQGTKAALAIVASLVVSALGATPALAADNEPPEILAPGALQSTDVNSPLKLEGGNKIEVLDPDAGTDELEVDLSLGGGLDGTLTLAKTIGLQITAPADGIEDDSMTFEGSLDEINGALAGLCFEPGQDFTGAGTVEVGVNDLGHNGDPPAETDSASIPVSVDALGDRPANDVMCSQSVPEDQDVTFNAASNKLEVADADAQPTDDLRVRLISNFGTASVTDTGGLSFTNGDGTDDADMTFDGTLTEINAALDGMTFLTQSNQNEVNGQGTPTLNIITNDLDDNGGGGDLADSDTIAIHTTPVNDDPINNLPSGIGTYEDVPKALASTTHNAISISEPDEPNNTGTHLVDLTVTNGTLTLGSTAGITQTGNGTDHIAAEGPFGNLNTALNGLIYTPASGFTGDATLTITTNDQGNTGPATPQPGGDTDPPYPEAPKTDTDPLTIRVDAPKETVYWASSKPTSGMSSGAIARAELDGGGGANLITGQGLTNDNPVGVAIDLVDERIYWSISPTSTGDTRIISANLDGTDPQVFLDGNAVSPDPTALPAGTVLAAAGPLVIDAEARRIYWASAGAAPAPGGNSSRGIFWANLDNPQTGGTIASGSTSGSAVPFVGPVRGLAIDKAANRIYWTNRDVNGTGFGDTQSISTAPLSGAGASANLVVVPASAQSPNPQVEDVETPSGIALDLATNRLFWANNSSPIANPTERLKVATLNGLDTVTGSPFNIGTASGGAPRGVALDPEAEQIWWTNSASPNKISHTSLDGTGADSGDFATGSALLNSPDGIALLKDPVVADPATVTGTPTVGSTLTCDVEWESDALNGSVYRMPKDTEFEWSRDGATIAGANGMTFTPSTAGDYRCRSRASNYAGSVLSQSFAVSVTDPPPAETPPDETPPDDTPPDNPPNNQPDNDIQLGDTKVEKKKGTAKLSVEVPGRGHLKLTGKGVKTVEAATDRAGTETLKIKPNGDTKKKLKKKGKTKVTVDVTFTPTGGEPNTESKQVTLKQR